jgi:hypothetical protein
MNYAKYDGDNQCKRASRQENASATVRPWDKLCGSIGVIGVTGRYPFVHAENECESRNGYQCVADDGDSSFATPFQSNQCPSLAAVQRPIGMCTLSFTAAATSCQVGAS